MKSPGPSGQQIASRVADIPSRLRTVLTSVVVGASAIVGLVFGLPLILVIGPIGMLLVYVSVISSMRLIAVVRRPSEELLRSLCCPWFIVCLALAICGLAWAAVRFGRGDSGRNELLVAGSFALATVGYLALMTFEPPNWAETRLAFRRPRFDHPAR